MFRRPWKKVSQRGAGHVPDGAAQRSHVISFAHHRRHADARDVHSSDDCPPCARRAAHCYGRDGHVDLFELTACDGLVVGDLQLLERVPTE
jgi:hypothetical protein